MKGTPYNSPFDRIIHFTYRWCRGGRHLKSSKEAQGTQEAQSVHGHGWIHNRYPQISTEVLYIHRITQTCDKCTHNLRGLFINNEYLNWGLYHYIIISFCQHGTCELSLMIYGKLLVMWLHDADDAFFCLNLYQQSYASSTFQLIPDLLLSVLLTPFLSGVYWEFFNFLILLFI